MKIPSNGVAEIAVIGKILLQGENAYDKVPLVKSMLIPTDFYNYWNGINLGLVYSKILELYEKGVKIDVVSMKGVLTMEQYVELSTSEATSADLKQSCKYVKDASMLRNRISVASRILKMCEDGHSVSEVDKLFNDMQISDSSYDIDVQLSDFEQYERQLKSYTGELIGISTGIPELDAMTWGLQRKHVWVVGGYRGSGKSFFGVNLVNDILLKDKKVLVLNLEMSNNEFVHRLIALRCMLPIRQTYRDDLSEDNMSKREDILMNWTDGKLVLRDDINNMDDIEGFIALCCVTQHIDVVVIDFIQLISTGSSNIYERMSEVSTRLQNIAKKYNITVVMLSQVNNDIARAGASIDIDGFKGAGEISQVANVAIKIIRERDVDGKLTEMFKMEVVKVRHNYGGDIYKKIVFPGGKICGVWVNNDDRADTDKKALQEMSVFK